jgi:formylglycine-generating enzyme required for sulfatase activity
LYFWFETGKLETDKEGVLMNIKTITALLMGMGLCCLSVSAEDLRIESFDHAGQLTFNHITNATSYRVEWAPAPGGPWTNSWAALNYIPAPTDGSVTCSVAMCYRVVAELGIAMALIPGGSNSGTNPLGSGETYADNFYLETYSLTVNPFYMDVTAITKTQWDNVYNWAVANGYIFDNAGSGKDDNHPVHSINWYDAAKWCNARSEREGLPPCYTVSNAVYKTGQFSPDCDFDETGYRLPTIEEWEYAARGGLGSRRFPWGDTITHSNANYLSTTNDDYDESLTQGYHPTYQDFIFPYTAPVGSFAPNGYGLYDMAGNMMTWCWEPQYTTARHTRGGAWNQSAESARCGRVGWNSANQAKNLIGLRAVRTLGAP